MSITKIFKRLAHTFLFQDQVWGYFVLAQDLEAAELLSHMLNQRVFAVV